MLTGNGDEKDTPSAGSPALGGLSALLDEVVEEIWFNEEAEEEVGVRGDDFASASCSRPTVEAEKPLPPLPSTTFEGHGSWRRKPRFRPSLSAVRDVSPVPPVPNCPPPPPPTMSMLNRTEASSDEMGPADKGKGKAVDEEQTASRPTFRQQLATSPADTQAGLSFSSAAPPIPRLPSPLPSFVRRMTETSAPPRLADRPLHPDLFRERVPVVTASQPTPTTVPQTRPPIPQVTPFIHSPSPKRASAATMAPTDRPVTPPQVARPELKSRWSPSPAPSPTKVQQLMKAMSFANLRSQKSKTNLPDQPSSSSVPPPVPPLPPTTPKTTKRSSNRSSAGTKKSSGSFGRGTSPSHKAHYMAAASCLDPTFMAHDTTGVTRPRTASERTSASSTIGTALSRQASTITPERTQAELPPLSPLPPLSAFPPVPHMSAAPSSPPRPTGPCRKISMPTLFPRKKKSSVGKKEDIDEEEDN
ncbi:hypothetical protein B0T21DRAFT_414732 [Apiosordaria backusii]|uniref:Uncharacterized protein n=1 Tax=Apiosordaria backusii TaxID=314023 RepID=A0AA40ATB7_9PEZI|nr:hypothetical protein B0T21DRAFT_414732 [Apiosordaria backusii]